MSANRVKLVDTYYRVKIKSNDEVLPRYMGRSGTGGIARFDSSDVAKREAWDYAKSLSQKDLETTEITVVRVREDEIFNVTEIK